LMVPVAKCSFASFRDTPINTTEEAGGPGDTDKSRLEAGQGFVGTWWEQTVWCYDRTPLLGQEDWKTYLLFGLAGATVATGLVSRLANKRHGI